MNILRFIVVVLCVIFNSYLVIAQTTSTGVILNDDRAYPGYTLFHPDFQYKTFLIDNSGDVVHTWPSDFFPGRSCYLLENGELLRTGVDTSAVYGTGGSGGFIELVDWNGNVNWRYKISDEVYLQHHDVAFLPNGNILAIVWHKRSLESALEFGRNPESSGDSFWSEEIWEIKPQGIDQAQIVWKWDLWDHLVQDLDPDRANYGDVALNWNLVDINYNGNRPPVEDFVHMNAVNYNAELDHIVLSANRFNEIWVIDHGYTTNETAGEKGHLLMRWGNPQAFKVDGVQQLFGQHDAKWITNTQSFNEVEILVFNNGRVDDNGGYSTVDRVELEYDATMELYVNNDGFFGNVSSEVLFGDSQDGFYSAILSGADILPNGNLFICEGIKGHLFEWNQSGQLVWDFYSPFTRNDGIVCDFDEPLYGSTLFRGTKIPTDFTGLGTLGMSGILNIGDFCSTPLVVLSDNSKIYPNPAEDFLHIELAKDKSFAIYDISGHQKLVHTTESRETTIDVSMWKRGSYFFVTDEGSEYFILVAN